MNKFAFVTALAMSLSASAFAADKTPEINFMDDQQLQETTGSYVLINHNMAYKFAKVFNMNIQNANNSIVMYNGVTEGSCFARKQANQSCGGLDPSGMARKLMNSVGFSQNAINFTIGSGIKKEVYFTSTGRAAIRNK